jgi:Predicted membrane protein (DUF2142)
VRLPSIVAARARSRRFQWWISFALFTLLLTAWALSNPLWAAPDEPHHVVRAASVVRGQLVGPTQPGFPDHVRFIEVPDRLTRANATCFAFKPEVPANCDRSLDGGTDDIKRVPHETGRYPPTPYLVGVPTLVLPSSFGVYLTRIIIAALCGALFASALLSLRETKAPWLAGAGLAFGLTPMVFFTSSIVNPSALEVAGGVGLWASGVVLVGKARDGGVDGRIVARTAIAAAVLVLARPLGMLWLGLTGGVLLLTCTWPALRRLLRTRVVQLWGGVVGLCIVFELAWITLYDTLGSKVPPGESADGLNNLEVLKRTLGTTTKSYGEMVGVFGWLDTSVPELTSVLWTAALGVLVALGVGLGGRRWAAAIVVLLGLIIVVPAVLEFIEARRFGFGWQGRYTLPFAVGLPILCGFALTQEPARILQRRRLMIVFGVAFVVAHFVAFGQNLRRYAVGAGGPLTFWYDADWSPPVPSLLLLLGYAALLVALALWLWSNSTAEASETLAEAPETRAEVAMTEPRVTV